MKKIVAVALVALATTGWSADEAYLFAYFRGERDGLHLAVSDDGLAWTALNDNKSVLKPTVGKDRLMRDPSVCRGPDGTYHMVWTSSWHDRIIGYASSADLIHWSEQRALPVMEHESACRNTWAPELTFDPDTATFYIYWASTIPGREPEGAPGDDMNHRIYLTTTKDFKTFTPTVKWYDPGFNVIDAAVARDPKTKEWIMVVKDERKKPEAKKNIRIARTADLAKGFPTELEPGQVNFGRDWVEGPAPLFVGGDLFVYFDNYRRGMYNVAVSHDGGRTWEDRSKELRLPKGIRHGTALAIPRADRDRLVANGKWEM